MIECTKCGASWSADGFYTSPDGAIQQPCAECRKDASSVYYYSNQTAILEARYNAYHHPDKHEAKKSYFAAKRREYRAAKYAET